MGVKVSSLCILKMNVFLCSCERIIKTLIHLRMKHVFSLIETFICSLQKMYNAIDHFITKICYLVFVFQ